MIKNVERSRKLAEHTSILSGRPHQNSRRALAMTAAVGEVRLNYIEGWAVASLAPNLAFEHAWLHDPNTNEIVDVSLVDQDMTYFPAFVYTPEHLAAERKIKGIPVCYNEGGMGNERYQYAAACAWAYAGASDEKLLAKHIARDVIDRMRGRK